LPLDHDPNNKAPGGEVAGGLKNPQGEAEDGGSLPAADRRPLITQLRRDIVPYRRPRCCDPSRFTAASIAEFAIAIVSAVRQHGRKWSIGGKIGAQRRLQQQIPDPLSRLFNYVFYRIDGNHGGISVI
jgi:hypothetical protein